MGKFAGDTDVLSATTTGTSISASYNSSTETLTLTGVDTLAHYSQVLDSVTFTAGENPTDNGSNPTRTVTRTFNDGNSSNNLTTATTTISISLTARNDFNAHGNSDVLWQNNDGLPAIWNMNGISLVSGAVLSNPGTSWRIVASADFNQDANADIILQNNDGLPEIWLLNGTSVTSTVTLPNPGPSWHVIAACDFFGDGNADLLWQNNDGLAAIWEMNGTSVTTGISYCRIPARLGMPWALGTSARMARPTSYGRTPTACRRSGR